MRTTCRAACFIGAIGCAPLQAQAPAEVAALTAWVDTLEAIDNLAALERLDQASRVGDGIPGSLRRAHYVLRRGELRNDRSEIDVALFDFQTAASRRGDWPWPRFAMARAIVALELREFVPKAGSGIREGESNASAIWRVMQESLQRDPLFGPSRDLFLQLAMASSYRSVSGDFRRTLLGYASPPSNDWRAVLVEGRILHTEGDHSGALVRFDSVLAMAGDSGLAHLERARVLHRLGRTPDARDAYWQSLRHPSPATRLEHRIDLQWITSTDTLAALDALPADSLLPWMQRFWLKRDAENLRAPGERLTEHLRRWNHVREHYRIPLASRRTEMKRTEFDVAMQGQCLSSGAWSLDDLIAQEPHHPGDIRKDERFLDHRGIVYLRHGDPIATSMVGGGSSEVARTPDNPGITEMSPVDVSWFLPPISDASPDTRNFVNEYMAKTDSVMLAYRNSASTEALMDERVRQNESWLYWVEGSYRVLHFTGSQALGLHAPTTLNAVLPLRADLYAARVNLFRSYLDVARALLRPLGATPVTCDTGIQQMITLSRADATVASQADSYTPVFDTAFTLYTQFFGVGHGDDASGRAVIAFAIPNPGLRAQGNAPDGRQLIPIRFRLTFFDPATGNNRFIDTTRVFATRSLEPGNFLTGMFEVPLGAGHWQMGLRAEQPAHGTGGMARLRNVTIPGGPGLALGDLVVGRAAGIPVWNPGGDPMPMNPFNAWPSGSDLELWFEVRGLGAAADFRTRLEVVPERGRRSVQLEGTERATGPVTALRRTLQLRNLDPGNYMVKVTVTANGVSATRQRAITIVRGEQ